MKLKHPIFFNYYSIIGGIILILIGISCNYNPNNKATNQGISKEEIESYITNGQLKELIKNTDTLNFSIRLSGCTYRRIDLVSFFKKQDIIYIKPEIRMTIDRDTIISGKTKVYDKFNDTLSFEGLLTKIHELQIKNIDTSENKFSISIGIFKKWDYKYSFDRDSPYFLEIKNYYFNIMNTIYPEIEEFKTIEILEIVEDKVQ